MSILIIPSVPSTLTQFGLATLVDGPDLAVAPANEAFKTFPIEPSVYPDYKPITGNRNRVSDGAYRYTSRPILAVQFPALPINTNNETGLTSTDKNWLMVAELFKTAMNQFNGVIWVNWFNPIAETLGLNNTYIPFESGGYGRWQKDVCRLRRLKWAGKGLNRGKAFAGSTFYFLGMQTIIRPGASDTPYYGGNPEPPAASTANEIDPYAGTYGYGRYGRGVYGKGSY